MLHLHTVVRSSEVAVNQKGFIFLFAMQHGRKYYRVHYGGRCVWSAGEAVILFRAEFLPGRSEPFYLNKSWRLISFSWSLKRADESLSARFGGLDSYDLAFSQVLALPS